MLTPGTGEQPSLVCPLTQLTKENKNKVGIKHNGRKTSYEIIQYKDTEVIER